MRARRPSQPFLVPADLRLRADAASEEGLVKDQLRTPGAAGMRPGLPFKVPIAGNWVSRAQSQGGPLPRDSQWLLCR